MGAAAADDGRPLTDHFLINTNVRLPYFWARVRAPKASQFKLELRVFIDFSLQVGEVGPRVQDTGDEVSLCIYVKFQGEREL